MTDIIERLSPAFKGDIKTAIEILQKSGCSEIFIFGSIVNGEVTRESDIDIAIKGCPKGLFFRLYGQLIRYLEHPIDLVDLDKQIRFYKFLQDHGEIVRIA